jgi:hypothetical protein
MLELWNWWRLFGTFHGFWKWRASQGMLMNKKSGLLKAKHLLSFFCVMKFVIKIWWMGGMSWAIMLLCILLQVFFSCVLEEGFGIAILDKWIQNAKMLELMKLPRGQYWPVWEDTNLCGFCFGTFRSWNHLLGTLEKLVSASYKGGFCVVMGCIFLLSEWIGRKS